MPFLSITKYMYMIHLESITKIWNCKYLCKLQKNQIDMLKGAMNTWAPDVLGYKKAPLLFVTYYLESTWQAIGKNKSVHHGGSQTMSNVRIYWDRSRESKDMSMFNMIKLMAAQLWIYKSSKPPSFHNMELRVE